MKKYPTSFRLTEECLELIKEIAEKQGVSQRDIVEVAVREYANKVEKWKLTNKQ